MGLTDKTRSRKTYSFYRTPPVIEAPVMVGDLVGTDIGQMVSWNGFGWVPVDVGAFPAAVGKQWVLTWSSKTKVWSAQEYVPPEPM